jgi:hypothetical protein
MLRVAPLLLVVFGFAGWDPGCPSPQPNPQQGALGQPAKTQSFFACKACLSDDGARCATFTPECHDSLQQADSETGAKYALCDTLSSAELARRPTPPDYKPNSPFFKNACYLWPADAFKISCTSIKKTCDGVPIH